MNDESSYDLDKDPTVALVQASVIAARNHMAIPSKLDPDILTVRDDEPDVGECNYEKDSRELCPRGDPDADRSIVVFGNSHARMWIPTFDKIGSELGYRTYYFVKPNCAATLVSVGELVPGSPLWPECDEFRDWALDQIATLDPDLVVVASSGPNPVLYDDDGNRIPKDGIEDAAREGYVDLFTQLSTTARRTVLLRDVPKSEDLPDECLTEKGNNLGDCLFTPLPASVADANLSEQAANETGHGRRRPHEVDLLGRRLPRGGRRRAALPRPRPPHHRLCGLSLRRADQGPGAVVGIVTDARTGPLGVSPSEHP